VEFSLVRSEQANVIIETVKWAEDGSGLIVRLYECANRRGKFRLHLGKAAQGITAVNLMEASLAGGDEAQAVVLYEDGWIVDGYNRECQVGGVNRYGEPPVCSSLPAKE
jgi:Glycosyl hydrolases family 38 C-terminal beta sandwich domain